jgi:hypothetical protein
MKPRVNDFVSDEILTHTDMNSIQNRITDLQKRNGDWLGNEPWVAARDRSRRFRPGT